MEIINSENKIQEKQILIDNLRLNYKKIGDGNIPIILLHGWGINSDKYIETVRQFSVWSSEFSIYALDLPGFGKSDSPAEVWGVDEYAELVRKFAEALFGNTPSNSPYKGEDNISPSPFRGGRVGYNVLEKHDKKFILIGHSFGGQIAIKFAAKYPEKLKALILTGAAGIKHQPAIKQKVFYVLAKTGKIIFSLPLIKRMEKPAQKLLYRAAREKDYYAAKGIMKEIFKKVVKEDLIDYLGKIEIPTLLVWGANDRSTPLADGKLMSLKIVNCKLKIVGEANHSLPYQFPEKFAKIVMEFIKKIG